MSVKYIFLILFVLTSYNKTETPRTARFSSNNPRVFATCVENIGCIDTNEKWYDDKYRPVNLEPLDRHTIRTEFLLLKHDCNSSREILYDILTLKPESIGISGYKEKANTIFLIHDFTSNGHTGWIKHITIALSDKIESNVISVDWEAGAEPPFDQAIANARVVALEIKVFFEMLKNHFSLEECRVHLIGHGVGAHIAGYVGKSVPGIGRITGLDPTGPRFENMPPVVRLDANDALYVEVLHTDAFNGRSQGTKQPIGHADFYFNNAERQPGCEEATYLPKFSDIHRDTLKEGTVLPACSHKRSFKYYINAIIGSDCKFVGISCPSYDVFLVGNCTYCGDSNCATFGLTEPAECIKYKKYYIATDSEPPYCLHAYVVNITIDSNPRAKAMDGSFEFIFVDENKKVTNASGYLDKATRRTFTPGQKYTLVVYTSPPKIGKIEEAKVKWMHNKNLLDAFRPMSIFVNELSIKRIPFTDEKSFISVLCPAVSNEIKNNGFIEFVLCSNITSVTSTISTMIPSETCITSKKTSTRSTNSIFSTTSSTALNNSLHTYSAASKHHVTTTSSTSHETSAESKDVHNVDESTTLKQEFEQESSTTTNHTHNADDGFSSTSNPEFEHVRNLG